MSTPILMMASTLSLHATSTVSVDNFDGPTVLYVPVSGVPFCQRDGISSASCNTYFANSSGSVHGAGSASATSDFGLLYAQYSESGVSELGGGTAIASFGDEVVVAGGSGSGTLVAHYSLSYGGIFTPGNPTQPYLSVRLVQGSQNETIQPSLTACGGSPACNSALLDVTSSFEFGRDTPLGAEMSLGFYGQGDFDSRLDLTGYTVLDASGDAITNATITPQNVAQFYLFSPEPTTALLLPFGLAALALMTHYFRLRSRKEHRAPRCIGFAASKSMAKRLN